MSTKLSAHRICLLAIRQEKNTILNRIAMIGRTMRIRTKAANDFFRLLYKWHGHRIQILLVGLAVFKGNAELLRQALNHLIIKLRAVALFEH